MGGSNSIPKSLRELTMECIARILSRNLNSYLDENNEYDFDDKVSFFTAYHLLPNLRSYSCSVMSNWCHRNEKHGLHIIILIIPILLILYHDTYCFR